MILNISSTEFIVFVFGDFLAQLFSHLNWIWRNTPHLFVLGPNAGKYGAEKPQIWTLSTHLKGLEKAEIGKSRKYQQLLNEYSYN